MSKIVVRQTGSYSGQSEQTCKIMRALGLRRIGKVKTHKDNNCIRGMVNKVKHLVEYKLVSE